MRVTVVNIQVKRRRGGECAEKGFTRSSEHVMHWNMQNLFLLWMLLHCGPDMW